MPFRHLHTCNNFFKQKVTISISELEIFKNLVVLSDIEFLKGWVILCKNNLLLDDRCTTQLVVSSKNWKYSKYFFLRSVHPWYLAQSQLSINCLEMLSSSELHFRWIDNVFVYVILNNPDLKIIAYLLRQALVRKPLFEKYFWKIDQFS